MACIPQHFETRQEQEDRRGQRGAPSRHGQDEDDGRTKLVAIAVEEAAFTALGIGIGREESRRDDAPRTARAVHREGVEWIVDFRLQHQGRGARVDERASAANEDRSPRGSRRTARRDRNQAGEDAVAHRGDIPSTRWRGEAVDAHGEHAAHCSGEGGAHQDAPRLRCHCDTRDGERRAHVEAAPAEPQNEGPENLQHRRMAGQRDGRLRLLVEAADARADDDRTTQPGDAASHVHDAGTGKVLHAAQERVRVGNRRPTGGRPRPVSDDGVDEAGDERRDDQVCRQHRALCHSARDNRSGRCGKRELEPKEGPACGVVILQRMTEEVAAW
mmetsp:Transcript_75484/g.208357  ORF Transcript_75484/g.208357 Transcript_75484/m.208357 type:complete len:330 (+) Transcript_75484:247-1236(+)